LNIPRRISRANQHDVAIAWSDGHQSLYPARDLRLACPCASCVDEMTGLRILLPGQVNQGIAPASLELVGRYAIRIWWEDGHSSGIYTFDYLRDLCPCQECRG
jgi:ATP-binding protein involved in chromosome partitioning